MAEQNPANATAALAQQNRQAATQQNQQMAPNYEGIFSVFSKNQKPPAR